MCGHREPQKRSSALDRLATTPQGTLSTVETVCVNIYFKVKNWLEQCLCVVLSFTKFPKCKNKEDFEITPPSMHIAERAITNENGVGF